MISRIGSANDWNGLSSVLENVSVNTLIVSGLTIVLLTTVVVKLSWQAPPLVSEVSAGPFVVNCSKSNRTSQTAKMMVLIRLKSNPWHFWWLLTGITFLNGELTGRSWGVSWWKIRIFDVGTILSHSRSASWRHENTAHSKSVKMKWLITEGVQSKDIQTYPPAQVPELEPPFSLHSALVKQVPFLNEFPELDLKKLF